jgi:beta-lactamase superfamily II metal-dependent hydrolase
MNTNIIRKESDTPIIVFIDRLEKTGKEAGRFIYTMVFDFPIGAQSKENFIRRTELTFPENSSMVEVSYVSFEKYGTPREGSFYELPEALITNVNWNTVEEDEEFGATYIAFKAAYQTPVFFNQALNYSKYVQNAVSPDALLLNSLFSKLFGKLTNNNIHIGVYNVGQGNWNEISFDNQLIITYDFGSSSSQLLGRLLTSITRVRRVREILEKINKAEIRKILIISHWDTDHYIGINSLTDEQIKLFQYCIVPARIENETTQRVYNRLVQHSQVIPITMNERMVGNGQANRLTSIYDCSTLRIYKGTKCYNRNKRGLVLSVHAQDDDFVFPGDHHYEQLMNYVLPNCINSKFNFVVPHHGGNAGAYELIDPISITGASDAIISSGGRYGHPFEPIVQQIRLTFPLVHNTLDHNHYLKTI